MFILGHLGITAALAWLLTWRWPSIRVDYRVVLVAAVLPDLIDKPLGALLGLQARLWAHTLLFLAALAALSRVPSLRPVTWLAFGVAVHLLLDQIWFEPHVVLWPAYGLAFPPGTQSLGGYLHTLLTDPYVQFGEGAGTVLLVAFAQTHGLFSRAGLVEFLRRGEARKRDSEHRTSVNHS